MTIENMMTIARGLVSQDSLNAIATTVGLRRRSKLLDVPQSAKAFLDILLRSVALLGRHDLFDLFFKHVNDKLVDGLVARDVRALFHFLQQLAFDLDFVGTEH